MQPSTTLCYDQTRGLSGGAERRIGQLLLMSSLYATGHFFSARTGPMWFQSGGPGYEEDLGKSVNPLVHSQEEETHFREKNCLRCRASLSDSYISSLLETASAVWESKYHSA